MTIYDLYCYFNAALDVYMDSILVKEDPTEKERKEYEYIKYWRPSQPDEEVIKILKSVELTSGEKNKSEQKTS